MSMLLKSRVRRFTLYVASLSFGLAFLSLGCGDDKSSNGGTNPRFDPDEITIVVGDTIRFVATSGDHTVTSGTGSDDPVSGQLFDAELPEGDEFLHVFNAAGTFDYYCIPHEEDGMTGRVMVNAVTSRTVDVFASGTAFNPSIIEVNPGDVVRWTVNGTHTITSGTGLADPLAGDIFDAQRSTGQTFTFTFNDLGSFPYFCQFHVGMGMTGTVNVVERENETHVVEALE